MILAWALIISGFTLVVISILMQTNIIETYTSGPNNYEWKPLGKTAWFPVFGNTFVYNSKLEYKKQGNHYRYRVTTHDGHKYDIVQIHKLWNGSVIQIVDPTNPMTVEMAVQINDGKNFTSN